ncbi:MAG: hypothetical protein IPH31_22325 [Lewinellaceae bacterium]|nr:hypothetical protein [Lewinellaceae bacterium]
MLPALSSVSEAGLFSYSKNYLFPKSKDGMAEVLLFQVEQTEGMIEDGNYSYTQRLRQMIWNGKVWEKTKSEDDGEH